MERGESLLEHAFCRKPAIQPLRWKGTVDEEGDVVREGAAKGVEVTRIEGIDKARDQRTHSRWSAAGRHLTGDTRLRLEAAYRKRKAEHDYSHPGDLAQARTAHWP